MTALPGNLIESPTSGIVTQSEAAAMLRAAFNLFRLWQLE